MIYIVSGFMRSGTSMLMDSLSAGGRPHGLQCKWSRERDIKMNAKNSDENFKPNESYREIDPIEYQQFNFPLQYENCLIKIMSWGLEQMRKTTGFRCVFMIRDAYEIAESYNRSFGDNLMILDSGMRIPAIESKVWPCKYEQQMKTAIIKAETRIDCKSLHVFRYADVLNNPLTHFKQLSESGWPIDPDIAASQVNPKRKRVAINP